MTAHAILCFLQVISYIYMYMYVKNNGKKSTMMPFFQSDWTWGVTATMSLCDHAVLNFIWRTCTCTPVFLLSSLYWIWDNDKVTAQGWDTIFSLNSLKSYFTSQYMHMYCGNCISPQCHCVTNVQSHYTGYQLTLYSNVPLYGILYRQWKVTGDYDRIIFLVWTLKKKNQIYNT